MFEIHVFNGVSIFDDFRPVSNTISDTKLRRFILSVLYIHVLRKLSGIISSRRDPRLYEKQNAARGNGETFVKSSQASYLRNGPVCGWVESATC